MFTSQYSWFGVRSIDVYGSRMTSCFSLGLGLAVSIFQFWIVYHTVAQERDRGSRCG